MDAALSETSVTELLAASREYVAVSLPLSPECEPALTRLERAFSLFGDTPDIQPDDLRGMAGRIRELESDLTSLSTELDRYDSRLARIHDLLRSTGDFAVGNGPDPLEGEVQSKLAELAPTKRVKRKRGTS